MTAPPTRRVASCLLAVGVSVPLVAHAQKTGDIHIQCEPGVTIYLDGARQGVTDDEVGLAIFDVPVGRHVLKAVKEGYDTKFLRMTVREDVLAVPLGEFVRKGRAARPVQKAPPESEQGTSPERGVPPLHRDVEAGAFVELPQLDVSAQFVRLSPNGGKVATSTFIVTDGRFGGTVRLSNSSTGRTVSTIELSDAYGVAAVFSRNGRRLAIGLSDGRILLRDLLAGTEIRSNWRLEQGVSSVEFSPNGRLLAAGSRERTTPVWDLRTGRKWHTFHGDRNPVDSLAFTPDGRLLASGYGWPPSRRRGVTDCTVDIWDIAQTRRLRTLSAGQGLVRSVAFSADGRRLVAACSLAEWESSRRSGRAVTWRPKYAGHAVLVWDVASGGLVRSIRDEGAGVRDAAFSGDGRRLLTAGDDGKLLLWDVETGEKEPLPESDSFRAQHVALSADGTRAAASLAGRVRVWRLGPGP